MVAGRARIERIDDPSDPRIADYRDLRRAEARREAGIFVAEGREIVRRLLERGRFATRSVLLTPAALEAMGADLARPGLRLYVAGAAIVRAVVGFDFHRGCVAIGERGAELPAEAVLAPPGPRLLLILEQVANPDNVGGLFRNALAFAAAGVLLAPGCADPLYRKSIRVSAGASLCVPFAALDGGPAGLAALRRAGYTVIALTPRPAAVDIATLGGAGPPAPTRAAVLLGAEGPGLREETLAAADLALRIPVAAGADSLNVATAAGIALHHFRLAAAQAGPKAASSSART